jgi:hypothetical protein
VRASGVRATGVIVRFFSLLDVFLVLFGVLLISVFHARSVSSTQPSQRTQPGGDPGDLGAVAHLDFVYLYAGWKGKEDGRCFVLKHDGTPGREVRTNTAEDIKRILGDGKAAKGAVTPVIILLFSDQSWDASWDHTKLEAIERAWGLKITPVYNVHLGT